MSIPNDVSNASGNQKAVKPATTDKSTQAPGSGDGATFNQSDSFSFYTFRRGEIDPRTGSFNYRIPVARLTGNQKLGPSVELYLSYNHFTDDDEGFGGGWSLGLSKFLFTNERRQVILRDGRVVNVDYDESTSTYTINTVDIKDFILKKGSAEDYLIIYKDGITETLSKSGIVRYVTKIAYENGYTLSLTYDSANRLTRITDEANTNLLDISYTDTEDDSGKVTARDCVVELFKDNADCASKVTFKVSDDGVSGLTLRSCEVNLDGTNTVETYAFSYIPADSAVGFRVISQVTSDFAGPATEAIQYGPQLSIPDGAPWTSIPAVTYYTFSMTSAGTGVTHTEVHGFTYGTGTGPAATNNFLGYEEGATWSATAVDNCYRRGWDYRYTTSEKVTADGVELQTVTRTYDKYHRMVSAILTIPNVGSAVNRSEQRMYYYPGDTETEYVSLPAQYRLPDEIVSTFSETKQTRGKPPVDHTRTTTHTMSYDEYGNVLQTTEDGGFTVDYAYYPAAGEAGNCPAEPNGFIRYPKTMTKYKADVASDSSTTTCTYVSTQSKSIPDPDGGADTAVNYTVIQDQKETRKIAGADSSDYRKTTYEYFTDATDPASLGRLKSTTLLLSSETGMATRYTYTLSGSQLTIGTTQTGVDGTTLTESRTISCLTGAPLELTDNLGVKSNLVYDALGRVTSYTSATGTAYERTVTYSYAVDASTKLHTSTTTEPSVNVVKTTMDALGNVVKEEIGDKISRTWEYNTRGWLVTEHTFDYDVPAADGTTANLDLVNTYTYDAFGNLARAVYHDNHEQVRHFNIGNAKLTESINVPVRKSKTDVVKVYCSTVTVYDQKTMLPLKIREFDLDDRTLRTETTTTYDAFFRVESIKVVDSATKAQSYVKMEYDFFDRISKAVEYDGDAAGRTKEFRYWAYGLDSSRIADLVVDSVSVATQAYDGVGRLTQINRNPAYTSEYLTKYEYDAGYVTPKKITTPRLIDIVYTWCPELGGVPTFITPPADKGGTFEYRYDSALVKLTSQIYKVGTVMQQRDLQYDMNALLISEQYTLTPSEGISVDYRNAFSRTVLGRLKSVSRTLTSSTTVSYPRGDVKYTYDQAGRVDGISFLSGDAAVLAMAISYSGGELVNQVDYTFTLPAGSTPATQTFRLTLSYDRKMRVTTKEYEWVVENADNSYTYTTCASSAVTYDGLDRITGQHFGGAAETTAINHERDYLGRLTKSTLADTTTAYPKDPAGNDVREYTFSYDQYDNLTSAGTTAKETGSTTTVAYSYAGGKNVFELQQQTITKADGTSSEIAVAHDASGNVASVLGPAGTVVINQYDCYEKLRARQLMKSGQPTTRAIFTTNPQGTIGSEKQTVTVAETTTTSRPTAFGYCDGVLDASLRKQAAGDTSVQLASYLRGVGGVDAMGCASGNPTDGFTKAQSMLFSDAFGSVFGNASPAGGASPAITPAIYSPFGYQGSPGSDTSYDPIGFKGARFDQLTGLYHLGDGVRAYDGAGLLRFLQYDPLSPFGEGGLNPYGFCDGDPITFSDPSGYAKNEAFPYTRTFFAVIGFLLGVSGFGIGAFAAVGGGVAGLIALSFAGGVVGLAGGSMGLAAALVEDETHAANLEIASSAFFALGSVLDGVSAVMHFLPRLGGWKIIAKYSSGRVLTANTEYAMFPGTGAAYGRRAPIVGGGAAAGVSAVTAMHHGNVGQFFVPTISGIVDGAIQYSDDLGVRVEYAARYLHRTFINLFDDADGAIFLMSCGGTRQGAINNAQTLAQYTQRSVIAFPSATVVTHGRDAARVTRPFWEPAMQASISAFGYPWFPKAMTFTPT